MPRDADSWADWPPILYVPDLRRLLHYRDPSAVRRAMHRGDLGPVTRVGRRLAVLRESLIDHLRARESLPEISVKPEGSDRYRDLLFGDRNRRQRHAS